MKDSKIEELIMGFTLGCRGHDYPKTSPEELFRLISKSGWTHIQLAFKKSFPNIKEYADVSEEFVEDVVTSLEKNNLKVSVLGVYVDLGTKDEVKRQQAVKDFISQLWVAKRLDAVIASETTNWNKQPEGTTREEGLAQVKKSLDEILPIAKELGVKVALEAGYEHTMNSIEAIDEIFNSYPDLFAIFDPGNLLGPEWLDNQSELYSRAIQIYGERIKCVHFKGVRFEELKRFSCLLEESQVDYQAAFTCLKTLKHDIPVSREEAIPERAKSDQSFMSQYF